MKKPGLQFENPPVSIWKTLLFKWSVAPISKKLKQKSLKRPRFQFGKGGFQFGKQRISIWKAEDFNLKTPPFQVEMLVAPLQEPWKV